MQSTRSTREYNILEWRCECGEKLPEDATTPGEMLRDVNREIVDYDENNDGTYTPVYGDVERLIYYAPEWECPACGREYSADDYDRYRMWSEE